MLHTKRSSQEPAEVATETFAIFYFDLFLQQGFRGERGFAYVRRLKGCCGPRLPVSGIGKVTSERWNG